MIRLTKTTLYAFLIPLCAAVLILGYYYQNRKALMDDLAKAGVSAVFEGGNVSQDDIRQYFIYPPTEEDSLLRALEVTPEDLADLDKEEASRLKEPSMQLLLSLVIQHIAVIKYLQDQQPDFQSDELREAVTIYKHSLMADRMDEELRKIEPEVKEEDMVQYYVQHRDDFHQEGKQLSRHLMIKQDHENKDVIVDEIWSQLKDGEDFGNLIQKYSQSESQSREGFLGWHIKGVLHQTFEDVIWNMDVHEITGPIEIDGNLHFIQLVDKQERGLMGLEDSKPQIIDVLKEQERMKQIYTILGVPQHTIEQGNVESTLEYHTKMLEYAYQKNLDKNVDIMQNTKVFELYKRADILFQNYVEQFESTIKPDTEQERGWRLESKALQQLMDDMNFYFLVEFDLPEKETTNS